MAGLKRNAAVQTVSGDTLTVVDKLGEGGQGVVYKVKYKGGDYALKWYKKPDSNADEFYKNLSHNVEKGSPAATFLWPLAVTQKDSDGCFGYVMALRPKEYKDFSQFLMNRARFASFSAMVNAAILIAVSFKLLHNRGMSYQDLNDGNFFIRESDGDVLICDNDNVAPNGVNLGIQGKAGYMAPEVVVNKCKPDTFSDRFSLAVVLFMLFFGGHPLRGIKDNADDVGPDENEMRVLALKPVFVYDPQDDTNRPNPAVHVNVVRFWPAFPPFVREEFVKAFDKSVMNCDGTGREDRVMEKEWLKVLMHLKHSIVFCPKCKSDTFFPMKKDAGKCMNCGNVIKRPHVIVIDGAHIPLQPGRKIVMCEIDDTADFTVESVTQEVGEVIRNKNDPSVWGFRNLSDLTWYRRSPGGKEETRGRNAVVPIILKNTIKFGTKCVGTIE